MVTAALELVDEVGSEAFSLRELAGRLDSGTATLYRHFASKREILDLVLDRVFEEIIADVEDVPVDHSDSLEPLRLQAESFYRTLLKHPHAAPLLIEGIPTGPAGLAARERMLAVLLASGFPPATAARVFTTIAHYVIGSAMQTRPHRSTIVNVPGTTTDLNRDRYPATATTAAHLPAGPDEEFLFGLGLILAGIGGLVEVRPLP